MMPQHSAENTDPWAEYQPGESSWTLRQVVHLHHRAGFAGTWEELQRDLKDGPVAAVHRLLGGKANAHAAADFASVAELLTDSAAVSGDINRLKACWFYRMLFGPD